MKKILANGVLLACSLLFCLGVAELAIRCIYPLIKDYDLEMWRYFAEMKELHPGWKLPFSHFPNRKGVYYGAEIQTNADGFRDREFPKEKPPGKTRIMFLGDSFTLGWGVPNEKTFVKLVEQKLNDGGGRFETINLGVGNYNTTMELELFKWKGLAYKPDAVVLIYFVNDTEPIPRLAPFSYHIRRHSYLFAFLYDRALRFKASFGLGPKWQGYYQGLYDPTSPYLAENTQAVEELAQVCKDQGIKLFVVSYPDLHQLIPYPFDVATQHIRGLAEQLHEPFLDLKPSFGPYKDNPEQLWVSGEDTHGNETASAVAGQALYEWLRGQLASAGPEKAIRH